VCVDVGGTHWARSEGGFEGVGAHWGGGGLRPGRRPAGRDLDSGLLLVVSALCQCAGCRQPMKH
jgi:hypothetical protein